VDVTENEFFPNELNVFNIQNIVPFATLSNYNECKEQTVKLYCMQVKTRMTQDGILLRVYLFLYFDTHAIAYHTFSRRIFDSYLLPVFAFNFIQHNQFDDVFSFSNTAASRALWFSHKSDNNVNRSLTKWNRSRTKL
jgi:hypothetical protein